MEDEPLLDAELRRAIDACRPAALDPNKTDWQFAETLRAGRRIADDPGRAAIRNRVEKFDAALTAAFQQVPVPEGLADRLVAVLQASAAGSSDLFEEPAVPKWPASFVKASTSAVGSRGPRLRWICAAAAIAALLCGLWFARPATLDYDSALAQALDFYDHDHRGSGTLLTDDDSPLAGFPPYASVRIDRGTTWRPLDGQLLGRRGVAYDLSSGGVRATLYVVRDSLWAARLKALPSTPSGLSQTGGRTSAVWSCDGLIYVLVVSGNAKSFHQFVRDSVA